MQLKSLYVLLEEAAYIDVTRMQLLYLLTEYTGDNIHKEMCTQSKTANLTDYVRPNASIQAN